MMDLFNDSGEIIQRLWAKIICKNYPIYKYFWDEFIGERFVEDRFRHYEIEFPKERNLKDKEKLASQYDDMTIVHYSIFYNFASAHYQIGELKKAVANWLTNKEDDMPYFLHWESFNSTYFYLGNIFYLLEKLYSCVLTIVNKKGNRKFEEYLTQNGYYEDYHKLEDSIKNIRDYLVHFSKIPFYIIPEEGFKIPINLRDKKEKWVNAPILLSQNKEDWLFTHFVVERDLKAMEELVNKIDEVFLKELREFKALGGINIKYPEHPVNQWDGRTCLSSLAASTTISISSGAGLYNKPEVKGSGDSVAEK